MSFIKTQEGAHIFYKDWGEGDPVIFSHGWPLTADAWDSQMLYLLDRGYRVIAHDRRGHGRSEQTWRGSTMDQYADDLGDLIKQLNLKNLTLIGHSTGGGEVVRYLSRHGSDRVSKAILIGAVPPLMLQTEDNPHGQPLKVFDDIRFHTAQDRSEFFKDLSMLFYNFNRPNAHISEGLRESFWRQGMQGGIKSIYDCIEQFSETDFTEDLKKIDIPTLIVHGDDDQIVPIESSALLSSDLIENCVLKVYEGGDHGLPHTHQSRLNEDLISFIQS